eukprot:GHVN01002065.1.p1 GENE.GHVN01002065.1~~GHVN01002065.1.p1  ORF type:complete len:1203 (-),score=202.59 GHVN01002065.1:7479-11027(-)
MEARTAKGPSMVKLICSHGSADMVTNNVLRFLYGLLTGETHHRSGYTASATHSVTYFRLVQKLFDKAVEGIDCNSSISVLERVNMARGLMRTGSELTSHQHSRRGQVEKGANRIRDEFKRSCDGPGLGGDDIASVMSAFDKDIDEDDKIFVSSFLTPIKTQKPRSSWEVVEPEPIIEETDDLDKRSAAVELQAAERAVARKDARIVVQPGAASGRSVEQTIDRVDGFDNLRKGVAVGLVGIKIMFNLLRPKSPIVRQWRSATQQAILKRKEGREGVNQVAHQEGQPHDDQLNLSNDIKETQNDGEDTLVQALRVEIDSGLPQQDPSTQPTALTRLAESCLPPEEVKVRQSIDSSVVYLAMCVSSSNDELFAWGMRTLLRMCSMSLPAIETCGKHLAQETLRVFHLIGGTRGRHKELLPVCCRILCYMLTQPSTSSWFTQLVSDKHNTSDANRYVLSRSQKKKKGEETVRETPQESMWSFRTALLSHVRMSLDQRQLQAPAIVLLRRLLLSSNQQNATGVNLRDENLRDPQYTSYLYECMDAVARILIQASTRHTSDLCASLYVRFLLDYPMGDRALNDRVCFLLKNLPQKRVESRQAILDVIHRIVVHFPVNVLSEKFAMLIFLAVALQMQREVDADTHKKTHEVLFALLEAVEEDKECINKVLAAGLMCFRAGQDKAATVGQRCALMEVSSIFIQRFKHASLTRFSNLLPTISENMAFSLGENVKVDAKNGMCDSNGLSGEKAASSNWRLSYLSLRTFESLLDSIASMDDLDRLLCWPEDQHPSYGEGGPQQFSLVKYKKPKVNKHSDRTQTVDGSATRQGGNSDGVHLIRIWSSALALALPSSGSLHPWVRHTAMRCVAKYLRGKVNLKSSRDSSGPSLLTTCLREETGDPIKGGGEVVMLKLLRGVATTLASGYVDSHPSACDPVLDLMREILTTIFTHSWLLVPLRACHLPVDAEEVKKELTLSTLRWVVGRMASSCEMAMSDVTTRVLRIMSILELFDWVIHKFPIPVIMANRGTGGLVSLDRSELCESDREPTNAALVVAEEGEKVTSEEAVPIIFPLLLTLSRISTMVSQPNNDVLPTKWEEMITVTPAHKLALVKQRAEQVMLSVLSVSQQTQYESVVEELMSSAREGVLKRRRQRKVAEKLLLAANPVEAAKRKVARQNQKAKKRKQTHKPTF